MHGFRRFTRIRFLAAIALLGYLSCSHPRTEFATTICDAVNLSEPGEHASFQAGVWG